MAPHRPLSDGQRAVLQILRDGDRPGRAAEFLDVSPQRVSQIIKRLIDLDLVVRHGPPSFYSYLITPAGREVLR